MPANRCPWCDATIQADRMPGRGYVPRFDYPHIMWTCGSEQLDEDSEPIQSDKCMARIFREVEELRGEVQHVTKQRDDLLWFLKAEFEKRYPVVTEPEWLVVAATLRAAAEAAKEVSR